MINTNVEKVGVSIWTGSMDEYIFDIIVKNSRLFDRFYFITDNLNRLNSASSLDVKILEEWVESKFKVKDLAGNFLADILSYNAWEILNKVYGIKCDKVLKVDTDYLIYNRWLLAELFDKCDDFILFKDHNTYFKGNEYYVNAAMSFSNGPSSVSTSINNRIKDILTIEDLEYTSIGPRLSNQYKDRMFSPYADIDTISIQPGILTVGVNIFDLSPKALGVHLTHSLIKKCGFKIEAVSLIDGKFKLQLS